MIDATPSSPAAVQIDRSGKNKQQQPNRREPLHQSTGGYDATAYNETNKSKSIMRDYLGITSQFRKSISIPEGWSYSCLEEFVLVNGQTHQPRVKCPKWVPNIGIVKECFRNCFIAATTYPDLLTYCEGYAMAMIPVHHAWLLYNGQVLDPTWDLIKPYQDSIPEYYGVQFSRDYIVNAALSSGYYGVLSNQAEALLSGEHGPHDYSPK